jgi:hypothetical protein
MEWQVSGVTGMDELDIVVTASFPTAKSSSTFTSVITDSKTSTITSATDATTTSNPSGMVNLHASHPIAAIVGGGLSMFKINFEYF